MTQAVRRAGGHVLLQLLHAGRYAWHSGLVAPSALRAPINPLDPAFVFQPDVPGGTSYSLTIQQFVTNTIGLRNGPRRPLLNTTVWGYGTAGQAPTFPGARRFPRAKHCSSQGMLRICVRQAICETSGTDMPS